MWRSVLVRKVSERCPCRLYATKTSNHSRTQAEKQKRRREKEKAVLSNQSPKDERLTWTEKEKILYTAQTPPGAKKDTSVPFPAAYSPDYVEARWYEWWEKQGFFRPEQQASLPQAVERTFSMCIPPPNVTGTLHLGHALTVAVEDALVRWRRMQGHRVLWLPGCDHAGIATQTVVERRLLRESGRRRQDMSREDFLQEVWRWKNEKGEEIYHQLRHMGASLDWTRACFTMDPSFSRAVTEAFVRLCDSGLIYRSEALVNWSCSLQSAISDIEVDSKDLPGRTLLSVPGYERPVEFGTMLTFAYPLDSHDGEVAVSTTRPETMLGDVAIAVHPDDPRYQAVHGKQCRHPFTDKLLPIITDTMVDMQLGTGAVKVTPAHDHCDFLLSQRHSLPLLTVISEDGTMAPPCGDWLKGVKRFDARALVVEALRERKLFRGKQSHSMSLPVCSRSGDIIEPLLKKQWFVRCKGMAEKAIQAVDDGQLEIIPQIYTKTWKNWLSNISDWCVSRQLWWGHQIPAYRVELPQNSSHKQEMWVWGRSEEEARQRAAVKYGEPPEKITLTQDPDVLDTWFSSGLFPFAMLGWPQQTKDMEQFYPNSLLETGSDLIFFWVARMVMLGTELTGQLPFNKVLLHSLVRDKHGRKMSKSLGNVVDPLDVIHGTALETLQEKVRAGNLDPREQLVAMEAQNKDFPKGIPQCGTDALRFALCSYKTQGEDINLSLSHVLSCRHFCNKMWQTVRFTLGVLDKGATIKPLHKLEPLDRMERWVLSRLYSTVLQCEQSFEAYELHMVTSALHTFWVNNLCDVYMEYMKPSLQSSTERTLTCSVLFHCVSTSLALLSPFMPFITEELWQRLQPHQPHHNQTSTAAPSSLCLQPYPTSQSLASWHFPDEERDFLWVQEVVRAARSLRAQSGVTKGKPAMWVECSQAQAQILQDFSPAVRTLSRVSSVHLLSPEPPLSSPSSAPPNGCVGAVVDHTCTVHLDVKSGVNVDKQIAEVSQRRQRLIPKLEQLLSRLRSENLQSKVPPHVRESMEKKVWALQQELQNTEEQLKQLTALREEHTDTGGRTSLTKQKSCGPHGWTSGNLEPPESWREPKSGKHQASESRKRQNTKYPGQCE